MIWCIIGLGIFVIGITLALIFAEPDWLYITIPSVVIVLACFLAMVGHIDIDDQIQE